MQKELPKTCHQLVISLPLRVSVSDEIPNKKGLFVLQHWFEKVTNGEASKEKFLYFNEDFPIRVECETILVKYNLDNSVVRFQENLVYVLLREKQSATIEYVD